ncbi:MAG: nuclear transport factor 2 family protein [Gammaproteobacteria bacterium]
MMKFMYVAIAVMLIGISTAYAGGQMARWGSPDDPVVKHITAVETLWSDISCGPPQAALKVALAEDFQGTSIKGKRYDRTNAWGPGTNRNCQLNEIRVHFFGDSLAVVYGNESSIGEKENGSEWKRCLAWTDTWLKRDGKWKLLAAQDNVVPCK